jgi:transposase
MVKDKSSPGLLDVLDFITEVQESRKAQQNPKPKKRGRPATYSEEVMTKVYFVMLSKGIKEFKALWRYLKDNPQVRKKCGLKQLPSRTTLSRRMRNFSPST